MKFYLFVALACLVALVHGEENGSARKKIVCLVLTTKDKKEQANAVKLTWAKSCDKLLFSSDEKDKALPTENFAASLQHRYLGALENVYQNHKNETQWVLLADHTSYIAMENLRKILSPYNENEENFFGVKFLSTFSISYFNHNRGMVMSAKTLETFVTKCMEELKMEQISDELLDKEVYNCLTEKERVNGHYFCELDLKDMPIPESMTKYTSANGRDYIQSCSQGFVSVYTSSAAEMDRMHFFSLEEKAKHIINTEIKISDEFRCGLCWEMMWTKLNEMKEKRCEESKAR